MMPVIHTHLVEVIEDGPDRTKTEAKITLTEDGISLAFDGYGDFHSPVGEPGGIVVVERFEGVIRLVIWGDINCEEPTHIISLADAREGRRSDADLQ